MMNFNIQRHNMKGLGNKHETKQNNFYNIENRKFNEL